MKEFCIRETDGTPLLVQLFQDYPHRFVSTLCANETSNSNISKKKVKKITNIHILSHLMYLLVGIPSGNRITMESFGQLPLISTNPDRYAMVQMTAVVRLSSLQRLRVLQHTIKNQLSKVFDIMDTQTAEEGREIITGSTIT
jgi:hypothetical protein